MISRQDISHCENFLDHAWTCEEMQEAEVGLVFRRRMQDGAAAAAGMTEAEAAHWNPRGGSGIRKKSL